jgi:hypothetical protein
MQKAANTTPKAAQISLLMPVIVPGLASRRNIGFARPIRRDRNVFTIYRDTIGLQPELAGTSQAAT